MDCSMAQDLIVKRTEFELKDTEATELYKHVLTCGRCRESYLVFDECMEAVALFDKGSLDETPAPEGFTGLVMAKIGTDYASSEIEKVKEKGWLVLNLLWGFSAIILGIILFLLFNPSWLEALVNRYPIVYSAISGLQQFFGMVQSGMLGLFDPALSIALSGSLGVFALLFVAVMSLLLFVLHNDGKQQESKS